MISLFLLTKYLFYEKNFTPSKPCFIIACSSSQSLNKETYTKNLTVRAYHPYDNKGLFIKTLSAPQESYKVSTPLVEGKVYEVILEIPKETAKGIKEAKVISYSMK